MEEEKKRMEGEKRELEEKLRLYTAKEEEERRSKEEEERRNDGGEEAIGDGGIKHPIRA